MFAPIKKKERNQTITMDRYMVHACKVLSAHYWTNNEPSAFPQSWLGTAHFTYVISDLKTPPYNGKKLSLSNSCKTC